MKKARVPKFIFLLQIVGGILFVYYGAFKFIGADVTKYIFGSLGMEPHGRYLAGVFEILAGLLMLSPMAAVGSFLGIGIMLGALIAHLTVLGVDIQGDGGGLVAMLFFVMTTSMVVTYFRRKELPIIGRSF